MMTKNTKNCKTSAKAAPVGCSRQEQQLSLFDYNPRLEVTLTTKQLQERYGIPNSELRECKIGKFLELTTCVILHKGKDCWRVLKV